MARYSKAHEREENTKMWKGFWHSTFGILFCWVPLLGLLLSTSGFTRQVIRLTDKYKKRQALFIAYGLLSLVLSIGMIAGGLYQYSQDPNMLTNLAQWAWKGLTGQETLPGQAPPVTDYTGVDNPGLGVFMDPNTDTGQLEGDDDGAIEGDSVPDDATDSLPMTRDIGDDGASIDPSSDDALGEDLTLDDDDIYFALDFEYEVVDDIVEDENGDERVRYKVVVDKPELSQDELRSLFDELVFSDSYLLHTISVYKDASETDGEYTLALMEEKSPGAEPVITMK